MAAKRPLMLLTTSVILRRAFHRRAYFTRSTSSTSLPLSIHRPAPIPISRGTIQKYSTSQSEPRAYTYDEICTLANNPEPGRIIIDVREPSELQQTGRIPTAYNIPLTSNPDAFHLSDEDFHDRFGFSRPRSRSSSSSSTATSANENQQDKISDESDSDGESPVDEVIFYCKAGVRSRAAARLAREWEGIEVGDMKGGWVEWEREGGKVQR